MYITKIQVPLQFGINNLLMTRFVYFHITNILFLLDGGM